MVRRYTVRVEYDWILEFDRRLAQGEGSFVLELLVRSADTDTSSSQLLIPWRFFRLWALLDGIDPPENMVRCMANNYSTLGFWRAWHRSYNLWVVRFVLPLHRSFVHSMLNFLSFYFGQ